MNELTTAYLILAIAALSVAVVSIIAWDTHKTTQMWKRNCEEARKRAHQRYGDIACIQGTLDGHNAAYARSIYRLKQIARIWRYRYEDLNNSLTVDTRRRTMAAAKTARNQERKKSIPS